MFVKNVIPRVELSHKTCLDCLNYPTAELQMELYEEFYEVLHLHALWLPLLIFFIARTFLTFLTLLEHFVLILNDLKSVCNCSGYNRLTRHIPRCVFFWVLL